MSTPRDGVYWCPCGARMFAPGLCADCRRYAQMKEGARHPAALPSVPMFDDVPAPGPIAPPAPNLDLFRSTQERLPL